MKKVFVIIFCLVCIIVYGQEKDAILIENTNFTNNRSGFTLVYNSTETINSINNWISGELLIWFPGISIRYERMIDNKISIGFNIYWSFVPRFDDFAFKEIQENDFRTEASFRYYPWGKMFFFGMLIGFNCAIEQQSYRDEHGNHHLNIEEPIYQLVIGPELGWRIDIGNVGGFYIQPGIKLPFVIPSSSGLTIGGAIYFGMGYAF